MSTANINSRCSHGRTPLHWATLRDNTAAMKILVEFGGSIGALGQDDCNIEILIIQPDNGGITPFANVAMFDFPGQACLSLAHEANPSQFNLFIQHIPYSAQSRHPLHHKSFARSWCTPRRCRSKQNGHSPCSWRHKRLRDNIHPFGKHVPYWYRSFGLIWPYSVARLRCLSSCLSTRR